VVKDGALAIATLMTCTLSVDHRVIDGALAAEFMQALKRTIEDPLSLLL
jgi:pyruvate dehydrogenase E2 component (dihydrolipoamide acetyltransferase)